MGSIIAHWQMEWFIWKIRQELYSLNKIIFKCVKHQPIKSHGKFSKFTVIVGDIKMTLSELVRSGAQKKTRKLENLNYNTNKLDYARSYRTAIQSNIVFSNVYIYKNILSAQLQNSAVQKKKYHTTEINNQNGTKNNVPRDVITSF